VGGNVDCLAVTEDAYWLRERHTKVFENVTKPNSLYCCNGKCSLFKDVDPMIQGILVLFFTD
ncbi:hypothetical protein PIB30_046303, partial [Stylosanthes scabra]|nr:hypothetical protein [Stylosanthes scabra]